MAWWAFGDCCIRRSSATATRRSHESWLTELTATHTEKCQRHSPLLGYGCTKAWPFTQSNIMWECVVAKLWKANTQGSNVAGLRAAHLLQEDGCVKQHPRHLDCGAPADEQRLAQARSQSKPDAPHDALQSRSLRAPLGSTSHSHRQISSPYFTS